MRTTLHRILGAVRSLLGPLGLERCDPLRKLHRRIKRLLKKRTAEIDGLFLRLDADDSLDLSIDPNYEAFERERLGSWIREGDVVIDVGAHIGLFSLLMARLAGPAGRVFSFEPCPDSFALLLGNIEANGLRNIHATQAAVSSRRGTVQLFLNPENSGDHRVYSDGEGRKSIDVPCLPLDTFEPLAGGGADFIKMDVQGAEMEALFGMEGLLSRSPEVVLLMEFWPHGLRSFGTNPTDLLQFLTARGFHLYRVNEEDRGLEEIPTGGEEEWLTRLESGFDPTLHEHVNLFCVKGGRPD